MASLRRVPRSPYWIACFTLPDGTRTNRSTGTADKRQAQRIANDFEDAADEAKAGRLTEARARKTIADIFAKHGEVYFRDNDCMVYYDSRGRRSSSRRECTSEQLRLADREIANYR